MIKKTLTMTVTNKNLVIFWALLLIIPGLITRKTWISGEFNLPVVLIISWTICYPILIFFFRRFAEIIYDLWILLGVFLGTVNSFIVLGAIFFFVISPMGIFMKIFRNFSIETEKENSQTYFTKLNEQVTWNEGYERQF